MNSFSVYHFLYHYLVIILKDGTVRYSLVDQQLNIKIIFCTRLLKLFTF